MWKLNDWETLYLLTYDAGKQVERHTLMSNFERLGRPPVRGRRFLFVGLDEKPAEGVSAKVLCSESHVHARDPIIKARVRHLRQVCAKGLRSESRVHARVTVNDGADETCQVFARV